MDMLSPPNLLSLLKNDGVQAQTSLPSSSSLTLCNIRFITNETACLEEFIRKSNFDLSRLTEIWAGEDKDLG